MANRKKQNRPFHSGVSGVLLFRKGREVRPSHATVGGLFQTGNKNTH